MTFNLRTMIGSIVIAFALSGCGELQEAVNEIVSEQPIPETDQKVVLFTRDAGATTAISYQVSIVGAHAPLPNDAGNVFICDHSEKPVVTVSKKHVDILYSKSARVFAQISQVGTVSIAAATP